VRASRQSAVTNILRHSTAAECTIEAAAGDGTVRLQISNDGVPARPPAGDDSGSGLANLTARVHAAGGRLNHRQAGGWFDLTAEIPLVWPPG
jgi:two-component system sensor histidine kinase DesK